MARRLTAAASAPESVQADGPRVNAAESTAAAPQQDGSRQARAGQLAEHGIGGYLQVLTFHGIGDSPRPLTDEEARVWISRDWFEAILDAAGAPHVQLTFDDGNASDVEIVLPALLERGMQGRFFPLAARTDAPGYLSTEGIAELQRAGMTIGSQGVHHRPWRSLTDWELHVELTESRTALAEVAGCEVTEAACPFGSYDRRVLRGLRAAGYTRVFNSDGGMCRRESWLSSRTTVSNDVPLESWLELVSVRGSRRPGPVGRAKRLLKRLR